MVAGEVADQAAEATDVIEQLLSRSEHAWFEKEKKQAEMPQVTAGE